MTSFIKKLCCSLSGFILISLICACDLINTNESNDTFGNEAALGAALFSDTNLSLERTQSCATCHVPEHAFIDNREDNFSADAGFRTAVSVGDDGVSLGDRNAQTAAYAALSPEFHKGTRSRIDIAQADYVGWLGGQFHNGRALNLAAQAKIPLVNPIEMGLNSEAEAVARILENPKYEKSFKKFYGDNIFNNTGAAFTAIATAITAFENTKVFSSFDSKYDMSLRGKYQYDPLSKEGRGKALFFIILADTNCATCHQLKPTDDPEEPFTSFEYHNIGIPENTVIRDANGLLGPDLGLFSNPLTYDQFNQPDVSLKGKFKTPSLRNVAVTAPYMHNGVFREINTVIKFYQHYIPSSGFTINPETGFPWEAPEVSENISMTELTQGDVLTEYEIEAIECFLRSLTDARFEYLLPNDGLCD